MLIVWDPELIRSLLTPKPQANKLKLLSSGGAIWKDKHIGWNIDIFTHTTCFFSVSVYQIQLQWFHHPEGTVDYTRPSYYAVRLELETIMLERNLLITQPFIFSFGEMLEILASSFHVFMVGIHNLVNLAQTNSSCDDINVLPWVVFLSAAFNLTSSYTEYSRLCPIALQSYLTTL